MAAAIALRRKGFRVVLAEAGKPPIDKPCGEGLMPDGVTALRELGIDAAALPSAAFQGIRFISRRMCAEARFDAGTGFGIRRTVLHSALAERAAAVGVTLLWGTPVSSGRWPVNARYIIGADGQKSLTRKWAGLDRGRASNRRFGFRCHYPVAPWSDCVDVHWGRRCQIYITPVDASSVCVAVISRNQHLRLDEALAEFPNVTAHLAGASPTTVERGSVSETRRLPAVTRGSVALLGDAAGSLDAITGEGLSIAFRQAIALADALAAGDLARYQQAHRRMVRTPALTANGMLLMDKHPQLRRAVIATFAFTPALFSTLLAMHTGTASRTEQTAAGLAALAATEQGEHGFEVGI